MLTLIFDPMSVTASRDDLCCHSEGRESIQTLVSAAPGYDAGGGDHAGHSAKGGRPEKCT